MALHKISNFDADYHSTIQGNVESLDGVSDPSGSYQNFDDFAQRSSHEERRQLFRQSLNHEQISPMQPELYKAIAQIQPNERDDVARAFFKSAKYFHCFHSGLKRG